jgi:hypothetical protein
VEGGVKGGAWLVVFPLALWYGVLTVVGFNFWWRIAAVGVAAPVLLLQATAEAWGQRVSEWRDAHRLLEKADPEFAQELAGRDSP